MNDQTVRLESVSASYGGGGTADPVFTDVSFSLKPGEMCLLRGRSGCGKTTFLHVLGGLLRPCAGEVYWRGVSVSGLRKSLNELRGRTFSFIFQNHCLLPELTALENVMVPWRIVGRVGTVRAAKARAMELLASVALEGKGDSAVQRLSGGERQRVAVARALMESQPFIIADEPTGSLDEESETAVVELLVKINGERGAGVLVATHGTAFDRHCHRIFRLP
ncbi:MAG: ABC transporter ATP-binding protein [Puniceicoccales bacterium]|jgi:ABC-type lipoprotein export system ATPase subunit|nr:ABC transporter ATP-binding protein [Puniceicoccales bacterium]